MTVTNKILVILLFTILAFVGITIFFNWNDKQIQSELINMFLGLCATELVAMGGIKIFSKNLPTPKKEPKKKEIESKKETIIDESAIDDAINTLTKLKKKGD